MNSKRILNENMLGMVSGGMAEDAQEKRCECCSHLLTVNVNGYVCDNCGAVYDSTGKLIQQPTLLK